MAINKQTAGMLCVLLLAPIMHPASAAPVPVNLAVLADCAGAVAVFGHVDPRGGGNNARDPWFMTYAYIMSDMVDVANPEKAHDAAVQRWDFWRKQPVAAVSSKARACKAKYPQ